MATRSWHTDVGTTYKHRNCSINDLFFAEHGGYGGRMSEEMSEKIAHVAEFKVMKDDSKPFLGNGGSVGKHDTYPPSFKNGLCRA